MRWEEIATGGNAGVNYQLSAIWGNRGLASGGR